MNALPKWSSPLDTTFGSGSGKNTGGSRERIWCFVPWSTGSGTFSGDLTGVCSRSRLARTIYRKSITFSSHFECTDSPQSLHVFPCLLSPQIEDCRGSVQKQSMKGCTHPTIPALSGDSKRRTLKGVRTLGTFVTYRHGLSMSYEPLIRTKSTPARAVVIVSISASRIVLEFSYRDAWCCASR